MKLTKKLALQYCLELWRDLQRTGSGEKSTSALWKKNGGHVPEMAHGCPCCEFLFKKIKLPNDDMPCGAGEEDDLSVSPEKAGCPMAGLWPNGCCKEGPFHDWFWCNNPLERQKHAKTIADYAEKMLKECD